MPSQYALSEKALEQIVQREFGLLGEALLSEVRQELRAGLQDMRSAMSLKKATLFGEDEHSQSCPVSNSMQLSAGSNSLRPQAPSQMSSRYSGNSNSLVLSDGGGYTSVASDAGGYAPLSASGDESNDDALEAKRRSRSSRRYCTLDLSPEEKVKKRRLLAKQITVRRTGAFSNLCSGSIGQMLQQSGVKGIVRDHRFETAAGLLVSFNVIWLGMATQIDSIYDLNPPQAYQTAFEAGDLVFMCLFLIEWLLRLYVDGKSFLFTRGTFWNWFDTFIVSVQVLDQCAIAIRRWGGMHVHGRSNMGDVNILRMMRMFRILRVIRLLHLFDELDMLLRSIALAGSSLLWALFLMSTMVYAFSVFFVQRTLQMTGGSLPSDVDNYFGGIPRTALTLFESLLGGLSWDVPVTLLYTEIGWFSAVLFLLYVSIGLFVLLNVATGVFIDKAMKTAEEEDHLRIAEGLAAAFNLTGLEHEAEEVTLESFRTKLQEPVMAEYLDKVSIDADHIDKFYGLLDADDSGSLSFSEVVSGCVKLCGHARAVDIALLAQDQKELTERLARHVGLVERMMGSLLHSATHTGHSQPGQFGARVSQKIDAENLASMPLQRLKSCLDMEHLDTTSPRLNPKRPWNKPKAKVFL